MLEPPRRAAAARRAFRGYYMSSDSAKKAAASSPPPQDREVGCLCSPTRPPARQHAVEVRSAAVRSRPRARRQRRADRGTAVDGVPDRVVAPQHANPDTRSNHRVAPRSTPDAQMTHASAARRALAQPFLTHTVVTAVRGFPLRAITASAGAPARLGLPATASSRPGGISAPPPRFVQTLPFTLCR